MQIELGASPADVLELGPVALIFVLAPVVAALQRLGRRRCRPRASLAER
ncbi:hypothetical protein [Rathayibacter sp. AY1C9]|nr:hypothetical protein [Rathayibacter sp. AY1C9]